MLALTTLALTLAASYAQEALLTPLLQQGLLDEARALSSVKVEDNDYGYAGYFSTPAQHNKDRLNHIYFWYQPCTECANQSEAPLLVWLQGGPGGPGGAGRPGRAGQQRQAMAIGKVGQS